jgi:hypothetical protein
MPLNVAWVPLLACMAFKSDTWILVDKSPSDHRPGSASRMVLRINRSCLVAQCLGITERVTAAAMPI